MRLIALCPFGLEKLLKDELGRLGLKSESASGKVFFEGTWEDVYRSNLYLRTAERVLIEIGRFPAATFDELFDGLTALPWEDWLSPHTTIVVEKVKIFKSKLSSVPTVQGMAQKAVFQRLADRWGLRTLPQTGPKTGLRLYLENDRALTAVDTTGSALHNRGYRKQTGEAPLKENLAAALLLFSGWRRKYPLYDPLCGAGTILAEALQFAFDIPPGINREFSFEHLVPHQALAWKILKDDARGGMNFTHRIRICGSDKDGRVLEAARSNLRLLGHQQSIQLEHLSMEEARAETVRGLDPGEKGFLITNPPYGERLETRAHAENLSRQMRHFATNFPGWKIGVLTSLVDFSSQIDRKPYVVRELVNGSLPVKYYQFES